MNKNSNLCIGCWRTIDEIMAWRAQSDEEKKRVWTLIEQRKSVAKKVDSGVDMNIDAGAKRKTL